MSQNAECVPDCKTTHTYSGLHDYEDRPDGSKVCRKCGKFGRYPWEVQNNSSEAP